MKSLTNHVGPALTLLLLFACGLCGRASAVRTLPTYPRLATYAGGLGGWHDAQFDTLRLGLIKVAVRVTELVTKIRISLPTGFAYQHGFATLAARLAKLPP